MAQENLAPTVGPDHSAPGASRAPHFQLDTSGVVDGVMETGPASLIMVRWSELDPFTQGYIGALFADFHYAPTAERLAPDRGFSDLAPETLARIIEDCAAFQAWRSDLSMSAKEGAWFWDHRQTVGWPDFRPLTVTLGDDGKVRFQ